MSVTDEVHDFDFAAFIAGTGIFVGLAVIGYQYAYDWAIPFSAIGPLYIGYKSKSYLQSFIVGGLSGIFLAIASIYGLLGPMVNPIFSPIIMNIMIVIACFIIGGFISIVGNLFKVNRDQALEMAEAEKKGSKNVKVGKYPAEPGINRIKNRFKKDKNTDNRKTSKNIKK
ncbi:MULTISPECIES: hypothetical protein [Methanobrevibacter]|jgi:hypothetical protein|uniref:hypothetical protein n=1 Tax=Methanobrevibacter TaxID=2172 RepID=UPI0003348754|nr:MULTISPECIES: hypothetical protein [Methanobrevibacter]AGN17261.1 hypothetical protein Abm4_1384 [Methanobrevibacter sp. AbM4]MCI6774631.1 hypothetical protein [Methanobrevibacter boviskoreani]MCI6930183.1 hypothetical protein [Methanobrevibacter boviskoreani]MDD6256936.1 hypothetical protein [Methanobrevibacter boviskoreani]MDY5614147.1 hypothetical protein [Methanobrevibacter boviskoreani]